MSVNKGWRWSLRATSSYLQSFVGVLVVVVNLSAISIIFSAVPVAAVAAAATNPTNPTNQSTYNIKSFNKAYVNAFAKKLGGDFGEHLSWLADTTMFFNFPGYNGLLLQGYFIPSAEDKAATKKGGWSGVSKATVPVIVYSAGWTETVLKYAKFLRILHQMGYSIFSFDLRGQGFSSPTGYDKGLMTHVTSFDEYVNDLDIFLNEHVTPRIRPNAKQCSDAAAAAAAISGSDGENEVAVGGTCTEDREYIFVGQSMSTLVGLHLQLRKPDTFSKMVLCSPAIQPLGLNPVIRLAIYTATVFGFGPKLLVRLPADITDLKNTHSPENALAWRVFRDLAPDNLVIQGPSVSFMSALTGAADLVLKNAPSITCRVLVLQAGEDTFVDNNAMGKFFVNLGSLSSRMLRFGSAYHELMIESEDVFSEVVDEVSRFLSLKVTKEESAQAIIKRKAEAKNDGFVSYALYAAACVFPFVM